MRRDKKPQLPDMNVLLDLENQVVKINGITFKYQWVEPRHVPRKRIGYRFCGIELMPDGIVKGPEDDRAA